MKGDWEVGQKTKRQGGKDQSGGCTREVLRAIQGGERKWNEIESEGKGGSGGEFKDKEDQKRLGK